MLFKTFEALKRLTNNNNNKKIRIEKPIVFTTDQNVRLCSINNQNELKCK